MRNWISYLTLAAATAGLLAGCHRAAGPYINYTGASHTYPSPEMNPKTVVLVDTCRDEEIFAIDIPPGQQLTIDFEKGMGDDPVYSPDLMRYQIWEIGQQSGKLRNAITVPGANCRRVDVYGRRGPETPGQPPAQRTRINSEEPVWWSTQGGPMPQRRSAATMYDH